jgi:hypothetical protein
MPFLAQISVFVMEDNVRLEGIDIALRLKIRQVIWKEPRDLYRTDEDNISTDDHSSASLHDDAFSLARVPSDAGGAA